MLSLHSHEIPPFINTKRHRIFCCFAEDINATQTAALAGVNRSTVKLCFKELRLLICKFLSERRRGKQGNLSLMQAVLAQGGFAVNEAAALPSRPLTSLWSAVSAVSLWASLLSARHSAKLPAQQVWIRQLTAFAKQLPPARLMQAQRSLSSRQYSAGLQTLCRPFTLNPPTASTSL